MWRFALRQQLDGLTQRGAADAELLGEIGFRGQAFTNLHITCAYGLGNTKRDDLAGPQQLYRLEHELG